MKALFIKTFVLLSLLSSCNKQKEPLFTTKNGSDVKTTNDPEGLKLMKEKCYACHSVTTQSHDEIIAPPMIAVKKRYNMQFDNKEDFVKAIVAYTSNPIAENALMKGAVNKFNTMPKQNFDKNELEKIASYIYDNPIEAPKWFQTHYEQNHTNGKRNGKL